MSLTFAPMFRYPDGTVRPECSGKVSNATGPPHPKSQWFPVSVDCSPTATFATVKLQVGQHQVRFLDVGCGFGGLLMALSPKFPDKLLG